MYICIVTIIRPYIKVKVHLSSADAVDGKRASKFATIFEYVYKEVNQVVFCHYIFRRVQ